jgi:hypothetical protein
MALPAIKHKIRGNVYHARLDLGGSTSDVCGAGAVYRLGTISLRLGPVNVGVCCGMDDEVWALSPENRAHRTSLCDVQLTSPASQDLPIGGRRSLKLPTQLTLGSGNERRLCGSTHG